MDPYSALNVYNGINQQATDIKKGFVALSQGICYKTTQMLRNLRSPFTLCKGDKTLRSPPYPDYIHSEHALIVRLESERGINGISLLLLLLMAAETGRVIHISLYKLRVISTRN